MNAPPGIAIWLACSLPSGNVAGSYFPPMISPILSRFFPVGEIIERLPGSSSSQGRTMSPHMWLVYGASGADRDLLHWCKEQAGDRPLLDLPTVSNGPGCCVTFWHVFLWQKGQPDLPCPLEASSGDKGSAPCDPLLCPTLGTGKSLQEVAGIICGNQKQEDRSLSQEGIQDRGVCISVPGIGTVLLHDPD
jgi:hypothetical protein